MKIVKLILPFGPVTTRTAIALLLLIRTPLFGAEPKQPQPLPAEIRQAWEKAGAESRWLTPEIRFRGLGFRVAVVEVPR